MPKRNNRKPRILVIGTTDNKGGAASVGWHVGEAMRSRGYDVKYIVGYKFSNKPYVYELHRPSVLGWIDRFSPVKVTPLFRYFRSFLTGSDIAYGSPVEILNHPWYQAADVVHCHNLHGSYFPLSVLAKIAAEKRVVWTLHDMWAITGNCVYTEKEAVWKEGAPADRRIMEYPPFLFSRAKELWQKKRAIYSQIKDLTIVTPSRWLDMRVKVSILKDKKSVVIPNGIDTDIFVIGNKNALRQKLGLPMDKKIVIFVAQGGAHDSRKGWDYIAALAGSHPELLFLCIGGGEERVEGNIRFVGNIGDPHTLASYYAAADVFLFTSLAENFPLVVLEAMSCGLPIVTFAVGGVPEAVVHKVNGYVARYKDAADLGVGLTWALRAPAAVAKRNRARVLQYYSLPAMAAAYERLYQS